MANQVPVFNSQSQEPELKDVLDLYKRDAMMSTNCHAMATVVSFNPSDPKLTPPRPTIVAQINYARTVFYQDVNGAFTPTPIAYQPLVSVPVIMMSGGGATLTFPIKAGDQCLILFNDRSIDNWEQGITGSGQSLNSSRIHDLSDGLALIGFPTITASAGYDQTRALLQFGAAQVGVNGSSNKVLITNDPSQAANLFSLLSSLIDAIENITVTTSSLAGTTSCPAGPGTCNITSPASGTVFSTSALESAKSALGKLLE